MDFDDKAPVPVDLAQWPEARGFVRLYGQDPERQSRFVMALFGFRQDLLEWKRDPITAEAVATVIRTFYLQYPEFLQDGFVMDSEIGGGIYHMDPRLQTYMDELFETSDPETDPDSEHSL